MNKPTPEWVETITLIYNILEDLCRNSTNYNLYLENRMVELRTIIDDLHTPIKKGEEDEEI